MSGPSWQCPPRRRRGWSSGPSSEIGRTYLERLRGEVVRLACLVQPEADRDLMERVARRLDWEELDGLKKLYQAQADRRFIPQSQLWQGEDRPEDRRGDSAFLI